MRAPRIKGQTAGRLSLCLFLLLFATGAAPRIVYLGSNADVNALTVLANGTAALVGTNTAIGQPMLWYVSTTSVLWGTPLYGPSGDVRYGEANGISADGNYISGFLYKDGAPLPFQSDGAIWTRLLPTLPTIVPDLADPFPSTTLRSVSNGKIAVGTSSQSAYRWSSTSGGTALPANNSSSSWANGITANGNLIVGTALDDVAEHPIAVTWSSGVYDVLDSGYSAAYCVSPNGQYIVGASDVVDDDLLELDAVYWDNGQRHVVLDHATAEPIEGQARWATDSGIIGGYSGPPGGEPADGWLYFQYSYGALSFDTWYRQLTGTDFPADVTSITSAVERNGELFLSLNGGSYFAVILWAAPADANRDRFVDGGDYTIWADHYLQSSGTSFEQGDYNGDHVVDGGDYTIWADNYHPATAFASAVPEPTSAALLLVGAGSFALILLGRSRRIR